MSWGDDWLKNGLPTFSGGKDKSSARQMIGRMGGPGGFKTTQRTNADGSVTSVQTKGDMPPQITVTKVIKAVIEAGLQFHGRILSAIVQLTGGNTKALTFGTDSIHHTTYFKEDSTVTTMPDEVPEPGQTLKPDVVLFGRQKYYSPAKNQKLEADNWVYAAPSGKRWQLSAEIEYGADHTTVTIRNRGAWVFGTTTTVGAGTIIAVETFSFSTVDFQAKAVNKSGGYDRANQWGVFGSIFGPGQLLQNAPNGSQAMIHRYDCVADYYLWPRLYTGRNTFFDYRYDANFTTPYAMNLSNYFSLSQVFKVVLTEPAPNAAPTAVVSMHKNQGDCYSFTESVATKQTGSHQYTSVPGLETWAPTSTISPISATNIHESALLAVFYQPSGAAVDITAVHNKVESDITIASGTFQFTNTEARGVDSGWWLDLSWAGGSAHSPILIDLVQHIPSGQMDLSQTKTYFDEMIVFHGGNVAWRGFYEWRLNRSSTKKYAGFSQTSLPPGGEGVFGDPLTTYIVTTPVGSDVDTSSSSYIYDDSYVGPAYAGPDEPSRRVTSVVSGLPRDIYTRLHWRSNNVLEASHVYYAGDGYFTSHPDGEGLPGPLPDNQGVNPYDTEFPSPVLISPSGAQSAPYEGWTKNCASWNPRTGLILRGTDQDGWV